MHDVAYRAMVFAMEAHQGHARKYTGDPYVSHLAEVAGIVASVDDNADACLEPGERIAVCWLHDTVEDMGVTLDEIDGRFGSMVCAGVKMLSDLEEGNRATRKAASLARLGSAAGWIQTIKVADIISNTPSIVLHDPHFAPRYLDETSKLLEALTKADPRLLALAWKQRGA